MLFAYEQKIICSQTQLNDIAHEQTIICRQLSAGHVVGSRPMKRKKNLHEMAIVALEGHKVRILHIDSWRRCVGVTRYFNTDFEFENFRVLFFNVQKTNWTAVSKRYQRIIVTISITETFVIQLWLLLLMLTMFESSLIKKLNLITLNLLGASFDTCFRLYCQMYGVNVKSWMS